MGATTPAAMEPPNQRVPGVPRGSGLATHWDRGAVASFAALQAAALSRGWKISAAALPTLDFNHASANNPGASYRPAATDPLFDL
jgi:hypothetical protein